MGNVVPNEAWWTVEQAAQYLGLTPTAVRRRVHRGQIPFHRLGSRLRFKKEELDALVEPGEPEGGA
jgi:excisionase family DNA binding protein